FTGDWFTTFGRLTLTQEGAIARGAYEHKGGVLEGEVSGARLSGAWREGDAGGPCELALDPGGNAFRGQWRGARGKGWTGAGGGGGQGVEGRVDRHAAHAAPARGGRQPRGLEQPRRRPPALRPHGRRGGRDGRLRVGTGARPLAARAHGVPRGRRRDHRDRAP